MTFAVVTVLGRQPSDRDGPPVFEPPVFYARDTRRERDTEDKVSQPIRLLHSWYDVSRSDGAGIDERGA